MAHFNHGLRGPDSDRDEQFVRDLCATWRLPLVVGRANGGELAEGRSGQGWEAAARAARYTFLRQAAETSGARYLATAHQADDQCETVLHHILRGTGLAGLRGIPAVRPLSPAVTIVRPLLRWTRAELTTYLQSLGQPACHDDHNDSVAWTRNRIRHELLPLLEDQYHAGTRGSLLRLAHLAGETQVFLEQLALELLRQTVRSQGANQITLERSRIADAPPPIRRELFVRIWHEQGWPAQSMTSNHWQDLAAMATAPLDTIRVFPGEVHVQAGGDRMQLTGPESPLR